MWTSGDEVSPSSRGAYANLTREPTQGSASDLGFAARKFTKTPRRNFNRPRNCVKCRFSPSVFTLLAVENEC